jgi:carboxymethylenebutenolidase
MEPDTQLGQDTDPVGTTSRVTAAENVWDAHTAAEFVTADVDATMATMTADPVVVHVPTMVGARGGAEVRRFYAEHFIGRQPADLALEVLSRTATASRVVDELVVSFTHTCEVPWILPGVAPTGRALRVALVVVIGIAGGLVESEHIYWDQASVLVQLGLLDSGQVPVSGAEQAALVRGEPTASFRDLG